MASGRALVYGRVWGYSLLMAWLGGWNLMLGGRNGWLQVEVAPGGCTGMRILDENVLSLRPLGGVGFESEKIVREGRKIISLEIGEKES